MNEWNISHFSSSQLFQNYVINLLYKQMTSDRQSFVLLVEPTFYAPEKNKKKLNK